jgi:hypothetical protein
MLLQASAGCYDGITLTAISAGAAVYPNLNRYVYHVDARDYAHTSDVRDTGLPTEARDFATTVATKDYNIFHDSEGSTMTLKTLSPKDPGETVPVKFYFDNLVDLIDTVDAVQISLRYGHGDVHHGNGNCRHR